MLQYLISRLARDEEGQTMAEYAVVLGVIVVAIIATLSLLSESIRATFQNVVETL